jgi:hypothetical protein
MSKRVLKNVELEWCKFVTPDDKYGFRQCNAKVTDEHQEFLEKQGIADKVKTHKDGYNYILCRQRQEDWDGNKTGPVPVVDKSLEPVDPNSVGNGSTANLMIDVYQYGPNKLTAFRLEKVQVLNHVVFGDDEGFEVMGDDEEEDRPF